MKIITSGIKNLIAAGRNHISDMKQIFKAADEERRNKIFEKNKEAAQTAHTLAKNAFAQSPETKSVHFDTRTNKIGKKTGDILNDNYLLEITPDTLNANDYEAKENLACQINAQKQKAGRLLISHSMGMHGRMM
jgi:predicted Zn-ribbon and HTH transcriptional regulator